jgi:hypothetical protein
MSSIILKKGAVEFKTLDELYTLNEVKKIANCKNFVDFTFAKNIKTNTVHFIARFAKGKEMWIVGEVTDYTPDIEWQIQ